MEMQQTRAILTVALMAAFADGLKDGRERDSIHELAEALGGEAGLDLPALYRDVLLQKLDLATVVTPLDTQPLRQYCYEMAVGVVNADGAAVAAEQEFLARLAVALQLPPAESRASAQVASDVATAAAPTAAGPSIHGATTAAVGGAQSSNAPAAGGPSPGASTVATGTVLGKANVSDAELDKTILNAAITNAALELLPESIATMAIIPLQLRLVYRIGKAYGFEMDASHAREFIATLGLGLTSQYVEQVGRRVLGGLLGTLGGGLGRAVGHQAASSGLTFATTYAIGRIAQRYYAGGRTIDAATLKATFAQLVDEAKGLVPRYQPQIEQAARTINPRNLVSLVRDS
jgi:uncharacterized protein (DUF697 family)/tellurite resistance protein